MVYLDVIELQKKSGAFVRHVHEKSLIYLTIPVGRRNSVLCRVIQKQSDVFSMGCVCHVAALYAAAALKKLPVCIDNLLIDIFYHFKHSSKRCEEFMIILNDFDGIAPA